nr:hypothetical protein [Bradyrhizobium sp. Oc8]
MLSRIPAVKWAFNRLRPLPHSGSLEVAPIAADAAPAVIAEAESETVDAPELVNSNPPAELLTAVEPDVIEQVPVSTVEVEAVDAPEPVISSDAAPEHPADVEPEVEELVFIAPVETETVSVEPSELVTEDDPPSVACVELEPVAATDIEPAPVSPAPKTASAPKARAKAVEPADRVALIRQRWAETGIRMWNPRLHGTGDATLNIQGRIGLLPPEPGETMPRYDKLEFKMLGGQIVCEGVIVEAPVHAGQRSFTRLAEPRGTDRAREPVRERQAALA